MGIEQGPKKQESTLESSEDVKANTKEKGTERLDLGWVGHCTCVLRQELQFPSQGETISIKPGTRIDISNKDPKICKIETFEDGSIYSYYVNRLDLPLEILVSDLVI